MDFASLLRKSCLMYADNVAVSFEGQSQTYAQLWDRACRLATALLAVGLEPGNRVAVLADNQLECIEQAAALALAGLVRCPMYAMNTASAHAYMLRRVGAAACIVQDKYAGDLAAIRDQVPSLRHLIVIGNGAGGGVLSYEALIAAARPSEPAVLVGPDDDHIIRFSAGTTGRPKGIVHSNAGWLAMGNEFRLHLPLDEDDAYLVASPMSHAAGLLIWPVLTSGARYVIMPGFDPARFLDVIERERCTSAMVVPTMIHMLTGVPGAKSRDLSSLRTVRYGAAPITQKLLLAGIGLWGNIMQQSYGQSEALPVTVLTPRYHRPDGSDRERRWLRSAGRPTLNSVVTIRDENDGVLGAGQTGEICVRTPGAMKGIWGDEEATAARFAPDGSVRTKDMGYLDDDGFLYIVDRKEDMIISGGYNIWPLEIENALSAHPAVGEAVAVGVPDDKWGEAVLAVVALQDGSAATEAELIEWARERVGPVKKPRHLKIVREPLPRSAVGKVLRRQARDAYWTPPGAETTAGRGDAR
jgi:acyl-CoA synthetase (AMP-forming)/AMP-acid ligase II